MHFYMDCIVHVPQLITALTIHGLEFNLKDIVVSTETIQASHG